jgi:hypothetical protein
MRNRIILYSLGWYEGVERLQSQLLIGKNVADFILKDGCLHIWAHGGNGFNFYPCSLLYEVRNSPRNH